MEFDLKAMNDQTFSESDGGAYYNWPSSQFPVLSKADVAAGRLVLRPRGFALPHYADSSKVGYVTQGNGVVGLVLPNESKEQILELNKGDAIPVPPEPSPGGSTAAKIPIWKSYSSARLQIPTSMANLPTSFSPELKESSQLSRRSSFPKPIILTILKKQTSSRVVNQGF
ncbi:uncharacterized protein LOC111017635 isoform X1 [Momordica charantia]|uniref:Uncharacterized protein LOC111017635 isoform X1 n=1 Tax=Momordica charantia TaxID=3673 RepID=A0A6J1D711_MOMCH|nr:uncharacterized protein LOC111017635 isoform X1 [Momordica charantia]XP_022149143.1 uncharacterized protein LOC111017635 isoform X1 [Momordica charantia]